MQTVRGTRDFLPEEMRKRNYVLNIIKNIFEKLGFEPMETPALEEWETLNKKSESIKDEIYYFKDKGNRELGLRFDLTVPTARVVASTSIPKPFRRYQIGYVWRYDRPGSGRYREFIQTDIDIFGISKVSADAEVIACACNVFEELGIEFKVKLNNRKIIEAAANKFAIPKDKITSVFRSIDKIQKLGEKAVRDELKQIISEDKIEKLLSFIKLSLDEAEKIVKSEGFDELRMIMKDLKAYGYEKRVNIDLSLVRGLDYYTGPVFEFFAENEKLSIAGGGRYDNLLKNFGKDIPATGIGLGFERIVDLVKVDIACELIMIVAIDEKFKDEAIEVAKLLRKNEMSCIVECGRISKQLSYAGNKRIPYVIIIGEKELKNDCVKLRDMKTGNERDIKIGSIVNEMKKILTKN